MVLTNFVIGYILTVLLWSASQENTPISALISKTSNSTIADESPTPQNTTCNCSGGACNTTENSGAPCCRDSQNSSRNCSEEFNNVTGEGCPHCSKIRIEALRNETEQMREQLRIMKENMERLKRMVGVSTSTFDGLESDVLFADRDIKRVVRGMERVESTEFASQLE